MEKIKTQQENPKGLHQRYNLNKCNGKPIDQDAEYFVLRVDWNGKDPKHIKACRKAILTYAENIKDHLPELAEDLIERYGKKIIIKAANFVPRNEKGDKIIYAHGFEFDPNEDIMYARDFALIDSI